MKMKQIPAALPGYFAGDDGHIYSTRGSRKEPKRLLEYPTHDGYLRTMLERNVGGPSRWQAIAPIVARTFLGEKPEGQQVRHLNGDKTDNRPDNLAYGTALDNARDRDRHGTTVRGERSKQSRHTDAQRHEVAMRVLAGERVLALAEEFGVSKTTVNHWARPYRNGKRVTRYIGKAVA